MTEKLVLENARSFIKSIRIDKSVTSRDGHQARVDLLNIRQNQLKLCTLKVQDDAQLAMSKFCLSKIVGSGLFKNFTIKGLDRKY